MEETAIRFLDDVRKIAAPLDGDDARKILTMAVNHAYETDQITEITRVRLLKKIEENGRY